MIAEFSVRTERWTDRRDKSTVAFRKYENAPKNAILVVKMSMYSYTCGPGSSAGIAIDYGLDGSGSNPGGTRFSVRPDRPCGPPSLL